LTNVGGRLVFSACRDQEGCEVWSSDGTSIGTQPVADIAPGPASSNPNGFTIVDPLLFFAATDNALGVELWALPQPSCVGDCSGDGIVTVDELLVGIDIGLGRLPATSCVQFDPNIDAAVDVDEIVRGIDNALDGCG
jgi:ELWxxDGT repeat protein